MPAKPFHAEVIGGPTGSGAATIALSGDINVLAEAQLGAAYAAAAARNATVLTLDFGATDYINSTGIALIVRLLADARRDRREVHATGLSDHYVEIFRITRLSDYMVIEEAADAAAAGRLVPEAGGSR